MKKRNVFWGAILILMAVLLIVTNLGLIKGIGFWSVLFTVFFAGCLIDGIIKRDITVILFSLAFLCIVWSDTLGLQKITPWPVLGAALLGSIGCSCLFGKSRRAYEKVQNVASSVGNHGEHIEQADGDHVECRSRFGGLVKYVNSQNLTEVDTSVSFGGATIYLDQAKVPSGKLFVNMDLSFGSVEFFIPKNWAVVNQLYTSFAGVDEQKSNGSSEVTMILTGRASFAGVDIKRV